MELAITAAPVEDEAFWRRHIELQKKSGLTRASYSRQNGLNYDRFGYWLSKCNRSHQKQTKLISIKLENATEPTTRVVLCTLDLRGGRSLKVYDTQALSIILDKLS